MTQANMLARLLMYASRSILTHLSYHTAPLTDISIPLPHIIHPHPSLPEFVHNKDGSTGTTSSSIVASTNDKMFVFDVGDQYSVSPSVLLPSICFRSGLVAPAPNLSSILSRPHRDFDDTSAPLQFNIPFSVYYTVLQYLYRSLLSLFGHLVLHLH